MTAPSPLRLHTLLADYPNTLALKTGRVRSPLLEFDFADVKVANTAFKPMVREARYDLGELAIVTYLQAKAYGKPYALLPATVVGRGQHHTIFYNAARDELRPQDLVGRRVGVRAYSQTTGVWLRGILADDYGVESDRVQWVTFEDPHVAEYSDPPGVERAPAGKKILDMLVDGELDAAILGDKAPDDPNIRHLIPDPHKAAADWARRRGTVPVNHLVVVRDTLCRTRPDAIREIYRLFAESKAAGAKPAEAGPDPLPFGLPALRSALTTIIDYSARQGLIPRRFAVDELFDDTTRLLGL